MFTFIFLFYALIGDSLAPDSAAAETTAAVFAVPEIVSPGRATEVGQILNERTAIVPENHELRAADFFFRAPYLLSDPARGIGFSATRAPGVLLNHHRIDNPFFGQVDIALLPVQLFERVMLRETYAGERAPAVDFMTKVNRFPRPYSYMNFTALGNDNIYNVDFTRAFTPNAGFYFSGLYSNSYMPYDSLYNKTNAYYINLYQNTFLPKRADIFFATNGYGDLRSTDLFDVDLVAGTDRHNSAVYYNNFGIAVPGMLTDTIVNNNISVMGINNKSTFDLSALELNIGLNGSLKNLSSDIFDDCRRADVELWQEVNGSHGRLIFSYAQCIRCHDLFNDAQIDLLPGISVGARAIDSLFLVYSFSLSVSEPLMVQRSGTAGLPLSSYPIVGNPELRRERSLRHEAGFRNKTLTLGFYNEDFNDFIVYRQDSTGDYFPENLGDWTVRGITDDLALPLPWNFKIGHAGSCILSGDSLARQPRLVNYGYVSWTGRTQRSALTLVLKAAHIGERHPLPLQGLPPLYTFSAASVLTFITLSFSAVIENIADVHREDFPNLARNFSVSAKWEFWD